MLDTPSAAASGHWKFYRGEVLEQQRDGQGDMVRIRSAAQPCSWARSTGARTMSIRIRRNSFCVGESRLRRPELRDSHHDPEVLLEEDVPVARRRGGERSRCRRATGAVGPAARRKHVVQERLGQLPRLDLPCHRSSGENDAGDLPARRRDVTQGSAVKAALGEQQLPGSLFVPPGSGHPAGRSAGHPELSVARPQQRWAAHGRRARWATQPIVAAVRSTSTSMPLSRRIHQILGRDVATGAPGRTGIRRVRRPMSPTGSLRPAPQRKGAGQTRTADVVEVRSQRYAADDRLYLRDQDVTRPGVAVPMVSAIAMQSTPGRWLQRRRQSSTRGPGSARRRGSPTRWR